MPQHWRDERGDKEIRNRFVVDPLVPAGEEESSEHRDSRDISGGWKTHLEPFLIIRE